MGGPGRPRFCPNTVIPSLGTTAKPPGLSGPRLSHPQNGKRNKKAALWQPPYVRKHALCPVSNLIP